MADVTGPISTLPGAVHTIPKGIKCDECSTKLATVRVQGETDSFGCEMIDMCQECYDKYKEEIKNEDTSGTCDWCKCHSIKLHNMRDYEEGMSGRVYQVCDPCADDCNKRQLDELDDYYDDYYDD